MRYHLVLSLAAIGAFALVSPATAQQHSAPNYAAPVYPQHPYSNAGQNPGPPPAYSGYDPFQFDARTGRFNYVPIPYEQPSAGSGYSPWQFNWYSGRWDFYSVPPSAFGYGYSNPAYSTPQLNDGGPASNYLGATGAEAQTASERMGPSAINPGPTPGSVPVPAAVPVPSTLINPPMIPPPSRTAHRNPATQPTTRPSPRTTTRPSLSQPQRAQPGNTGSPANRPAPQSFDQRENGGWTTLNGLTGRWEYDYSKGKWVFVLPPG
jgi:hypothetical protein